MELYYTGKNLNGLQGIYSTINYITPNSFEDGVLEFEKLPDERYSSQNNYRTSTFNSNKLGNYCHFLECDLGETYPQLSQHIAPQTMDLELLRNILIEKEAYVYLSLESYFDLRSPDDGLVVEREMVCHDNNSQVWSVLFNDKRNSEKYRHEF